MALRAGDGRGIWVAVFGPDGAGKTALIKRLRSGLETSSTVSQQIHFRPRIGLRQDGPPITSPHATAARGMVISLFKLLYWFADYWCGYLENIRPAVRRSQVVLFDRYYHDVLVDPVRYRLPQSSLPMARVRAEMVPQPDVCIVLDVPAEVLQARKLEVSFQESHRQRRAYQQIVGQLRNAFIVDANRPLDQVVREVELLLWKKRDWSFLAAARSEADRR